MNEEGGREVTIVERTDATFSSSGIDCAAWVYRPEGPGPHPIVVMAPRAPGAATAGT